MAKNSAQQEMLKNMMSTFGGLVEQQRKENVVKEPEVKEEPKKIVEKKNDNVVLKEEKSVVKETKEKKEKSAPIEKNIEKKEPVVRKEATKKVVEKKTEQKPLTSKEIILGIVAKGYELNNVDEKKKQTSIYLSVDAIEALDKAYVELSKNSVKISKNDIMAVLVKDFISVYENNDGKNNEVFNIALTYNEKELKKKITNWTPSLEIKSSLETIIEVHGLKRLKMKYNMALDMILLHYLR